MEFAFNINSILSQEICVIDSKFVSSKTFQKENIEQLWRVIDQLGVSSAKAQGLPGPITSASKLKHSDHHLYILVDRDANGGRGAVVGMIKLGHKKLFVYDRDGTQHEMDPLCVLDFYVHESRQRHGCGKRLFEHALQEENIEPRSLAIDRPSHKFINFLQKHYGLKTTIPQVNNFVVFEGFFSSYRGSAFRKGRRGAKPPVHPYKDDRHAFLGNLFGSNRLRRTTFDRQALDDTDLVLEAGDRVEKMSLLTWDDDLQREALSNVTVQRQSSYDRPPSGRQKSASRVSSHNIDAGRAMAAKSSMYSRHNMDSTDDTQTSIPTAGQNTQVNLNGQQRDDAFTSKFRGNPQMRREGSANDLAGLFNSHRSYLDRQGRFKVESRSADSSPSHHSKYSAAQHSRQDVTRTEPSNVSWTPASNTASRYNPKYQQTRLW